MQRSEYKAEGTANQFGIRLSPVAQTLCSCSGVYIKGEMEDHLAPARHSGDREWTVSWALPKAPDHPGSV